MGKQPYIPLYIGDWEKDTNTLSLEAEGALLKLVFKLWNAEDRGSKTFSLSQIAFLLKKAEDLTLKIMQELEESKVLNIEFLAESRVKVESRRMLKDIDVSKARSEFGKQGQAKRQQNKKEAVKKGKQNADNDNDNDIDYVIDFLNKETGSEFKKSGKKNRVLVEARLNEKYTRNDFEAVISYKFNQWGLDPKMKEYLRPETLFGPKFESYLQASKISPNPPGSALDPLVKINTELKDELTKKYGS